MDVAFGVLGLGLLAAGSLAVLIRLLAKRGPELKRGGQLLGGGVAAFLVAAAMSGPDSKADAQGAGGDKPAAQTGAAFQVAAAPKATRSHTDYLGLVRTFRESTELQQKRWNEKNEGKYWVRGQGKVAEVGESNLFSGITGDYYEITIEVTDETKAVLFYPKTEANEKLANLRKGQRLSFKGNLKKLVDLGFWVSGDILVE